MAEELCDICHRRPAEATIRVRQYGSERTIRVCSYDYNRLRGRRRPSSPFESLFGGSLDDFFNFADFPSLSSARRLLKQDFQEGDRVRVKYSRKEGVTFDKETGKAATAILEEKEQETVSK